MTPLRKHLQDARDEYRRATYAGDLGLDAFELADQRRRGRILRMVWMGAGAAAAVAACIVVAVFLFRGNGTSIGPEPGQIAMATLRPDMPEMPSMPEDIPLTAPNQSLGEAPAMSDVPSMPAMPGWGLAFDAGSDGE